jgi:TolA-binding protein
VTAWLAALVLCVLSGRAPEAGAQSGALPAPAANTLVRVSTSPGPDYTRLAFTFENPLDYYVVRREDVDRLLVDFGQARLAGRPTAAPDELIDGVEFNFEDGRLTARIFLKAMRYELRHFLSRDKYSCILDLKNLESPGLETPPPPDDLKPLTLPTLAEEARLVGLLAPPGSEDGPPERLFQRILNELTDWNNQAALEDLLRFRELFPGHPLLEPALFLLGDAYFVTGPLSETYTAAVEAWTEALNRWPQSYLAGRAQFMLAEADQAMGYQNEAAAKYKLLAAAAVSGDDPYAKLALLRAADLQLNMGLIDEARKTLEPVLEQGLADRLGLEAYARLGMADFYEGLYSQANEIFREALREAPQLYTGYPEMLYAMGEAYHYLDRPDLSRMFLMHALSLMPDHPKADVIMARIGDSYRKEGRDDEAMAIYGAAKRRFPDGDGGLISQVRLADMGALHSFFTQDKVFDSLERGARQATVEMYQGIVDTASSSPLLQLAYLKIGLALAEDGETSEAIKWLRDLDMKYPKSALLPEALPALSRALVNETTLRAELEEWEAVADLYADNSSYLTDADRPVAQRIVARAYEKLGRFDEAREVWKALEEQTPEKRLARAQGLVVSSLKMERPMEALDYLLTMAEEFPEQAAWLDLQADQIGLALARPQNASATADLLKFRTMIPTEAVRRRALADAVEIEINGRRYDKATALMDEYRREYPDDELTPEYLLTQAKIEERQKRYENGWDMLSDFRRLYPDDPRGPELLLEQIRKADALGREDDAFRFMALYQMRYPERAESRELLTEKMRREWDLGRYADSQSTFEAFRRAYPGDPAIPALLMDRAARDWEKGRYDESQWAVDEMLLNYPDDPRTPTLLLERAARDWEAERYEASQAAVDRLTQLYHDDPRVPEMLLRRAENDWGRDRLEAARRGWDDFRRAYPDDPGGGGVFWINIKRALKKG